jgi:heme-degrading monooxygenase HmoA
MQFTNEGVEEFLHVFKKHQKQIRNFPGCTHLELLRDATHFNVFATLSHWQKQEDLEHYRQSELFGSVWGRVKPLMIDRTIAFSFEKFIGC